MLLVKNNVSSASDQPLLSQHYSQCRIRAAVVKLTRALLQLEKIHKSMYHYGDFGPSAKPKLDLDIAELDSPTVQPSSRRISYASHYSESRTINSNVAEANQQQMCVCRHEANPSAPCACCEARNASSNHRHGSNGHVISGPVTVEEKLKLKALWDEALAKPIPRMAPQYPYPTKKADVLRTFKIHQQDSERKLEKRNSAPTDSAESSNSAVERTPPRIIVNGQEFA